MGGAVVKPTRDGLVEINAEPHRENSRASRQAGSRDRAAMADPGASPQGQRGNPTQPGRRASRSRSKKHMKTAGGKHGDRTSDDTGGFGDEAFDLACRKPRSTSSGGKTGGPNAREISFEKAMRNSGMTVVPVEADGNCLFRAVCHQVWGSEDGHEDLRQAVVKHMSTHRKRFEIFATTDFDVYLRRMSRSGVWADDLEIHAIEEIMNREIHIFVNDEETRFFQGDIVEPLKKDFDGKEDGTEDVNNNKERVTQIKLSYHGGAHYNSVKDHNINYPLGKDEGDHILTSRVRSMGGKHARKGRKKKTRTPSSSSRQSRGILSRMVGGMVGPG